MERDSKKGAIGFELTDTVLTEIDTQLAKLLEAQVDDSDDFDLDFGAALGEEKPKER